MPAQTTSVPSFAGLALALFGALTTAGCGPADDTAYDAKDVGKLRLLVVDVNDSTRDLKKLNGHFASSAQQTEKDREKLKGLAFRAVDTEEPVIEGDKATIKVIVKDSQDNQKGTATWTAVKENGAWKLTATPLQ